MVVMKIGLRQRQEQVSWRGPVARGAPSSAANENLPEVGRPGLSLRINRFIQPRTEYGLASFSALIVQERSYGRGLLLAPVGIGTGAALWFLLPFAMPLAGLCLLFVVGLSGYLVNQYRRPVVAFFAAALLAMSTGALLGWIETERAGTVVLDSAVTTRIQGVVEGREASGDGRWRYDIRLSSTKDPSLRRMPETASILSMKGDKGLEIGSRIEGRARLSPPSGPALPGLNDFGFSAYFGGRGATGFFYGAPHALVEAPDPGKASVSLTFSRWLHKFRADIGDHIRSTIEGDPGAFAAAIITNEQRALSPQTIEALRLSGLAHIIAISGMNMALSAGIFFVGLRAILSLSVGFVQAFAVKKIAAAGALAATTAYYLISGFAVSAERAFIMMAIMLVAVFFDRPAISLRNIALSALVIMVFSPSALMGPSFQMSYAGTLGLVAGYDYWAHRPQKSAIAGQGWGIPPIVVAVWRFSVAAFMTSLIGGMATAIFSLEHFQRLAAYGLAANLMATPLISLVVMPSALVAMLLMPFGLDQWPLLLMGWGLKWVIAIGVWVAGWGGEWLTGQVPGWYFTCCCAGFLALTLLRTRLRLVGLLVAGSGTLLLAIFPASSSPDLVISEDGRLAAFVSQSDENRVLAPTLPRPPTFLFSQWQRALKASEMISPEMLKPPDDVRLDHRDDRYRPLTDDEEISERIFMAETLTHLEERTFKCKKSSWCIGGLSKGGSIIMVENSIYTALACDMASIVVAAPSSHFTTCRSGALLITQETLRRTGALALTFSNKPTKPDIRASLYASDREWNRFRAYDWRTATYIKNISPEVAALIRP